MSTCESNLHFFVIDMRPSSVAAGIFDIVSLVRFGNAREICFKVSVVMVGISMRESFVRVSLNVVAKKQAEMNSRGRGGGGAGGGI